MRILVALGGNAVNERGQSPTPASLRQRLQMAASALAPLARAHELVITHGQGPQLGLLALQSAAYPGGRTSRASFDGPGSEGEGSVGPLLEQGLGSALPGRHIVSLLTQVEVDPDDDAFAHPTRPIGPPYDSRQADALLAATPWRFARDGAQWRRMVASPKPVRVLELAVIRLLVEQGAVVICAGGGGIPVVRTTLGHVGIEALIDNDQASALLACALDADLLMLLTDVDAVYAGWGRVGQRVIRHGTPHHLGHMALPAGSMGSKVDAALHFVTKTGQRAVIGTLAAAERLVAGCGGTQVLADEIELAVH